MTQPLSDRELRDTLEQAMPGPWILDDAGSLPNTSVWQGQWFGLIADCNIVRESLPRNQANARLIAAAPALAEEVLRLREALREIASYECEPHDDDIIEGHIAAAYNDTAAIARAALQEGSAE